MGNAPSHPAAAAAGSNHNANAPKTKKKGLQAPVQWNNTTDFHLVSPCSDLSNPSQFRDRHRQAAASAVAVASKKVPSSVNRRGSKVIVVDRSVRQRNNGASRKATSNKSSNGLPRPSLQQKQPPIPSQFYFGKENEPVSLASVSSESSKPAKPVAKTKRVSKMQKHKKSLVKKAAVAKHLLSACWDESQKATTGCLFDDTYRDAAAGEHHHHHVILESRASTDRSTVQIDRDFPQQISIPAHSVLMQQQEEAAAVPAQFEWKESVKDQLVEQDWDRMLSLQPVDTVDADLSVSNSSASPTALQPVYSGSNSPAADLPVDLQGIALPRRVSRESTTTSGSSTHQLSAAPSPVQALFRNNEPEPVVVENDRAGATNGRRSSTTTRSSRSGETRRRSSMLMATKPMQVAVVVETNTPVPARGRERTRSNRPGKSRKQSTRRSSSLPPTPTQGSRPVTKNRRSRAPSRAVSVPPRRSSVSETAKVPVLLQLAGWGGDTGAPAVAPEPKKKSLPILLQMAGWQDKSGATKDVAVVVTKSKDKPTSRAVVAMPMESVPEQQQQLSMKEKKARRSSKNVNDLKSIPKSIQYRESDAFDKPRKQQQSRAVVSKTRMSVASILQATYPIAATCSMDEYHAAKPARVSTSESVASSQQQQLKKTESAPAWMESSSRDYRDIALGGGSEPKQGTVALYSPSVMSMESPMSTMSAAGAPLVSDQAISNAAFLFSPSYVGGEANMDQPQPVVPTHDHASFRLSTFDSRSRVSATSKGVTIPVQPSTTSLGEAIEQGSSDYHRQVRFSNANQVIQISARKERQVSQVVIPAIESKCSDLTDTTGLDRESLVSATSLATAVESLDLPPTEQELETVTLTPEDPFLENLETSAETPEIFEDESSSPKTIMRWSYRTENGLAKGVTPLRNGRSSSFATNSPYLRFKQAKNRFAGVAPSAKEVPVKKSSPVKKPVSASALVHTRVAAVEGRATTLVRQPSRKFRRETGGHKTIAPRKATLQSPHFRRQGSSGSDSTEREDVGPEASTSSFMKQEESPFARSPTLIAGEVVDSPGQAVKQGGRVFDDSLSVASSDNDSVGSGDSEDFLAIAKSSTFDMSDQSEVARGVLSDLLMAHQAALEDDSDESDDSDDDESDAFAAMLNYQDSDGEDETISTIRQDKAPTNHRYSHASTVSAAPSVATVRRQSSFGVVSPARTKSSLLGERRTSFASTSENTMASTVRGPTVLPFREGGPVKPNEQTHRAPPGALCLSPMQRTPMQARKWRALAAAAQEKDTKGKSQSQRGRKSLAERNPNVLR